MFGTLRQDDLAAFLARPFGPRDLIAFIHVPKTAGSSLSAELRRHLAPYVNITVDYTDAGRGFEERRREAFARFLAAAKADRPRACSGHMMFRLMREARTELRPVRLVSLLRDPVARVVSDWRYARTPAHPQHADFAARFPTIESYVEAPQSRNKQARFLLPNPRLDPAAATGFLDRTYAFLGTVEDYALSLGILFRLAGVTATPTERRRATEARSDNEVAMTDALAARIRAANALDQAIYDHVAGVLARHRAAWEGMAAPGRAAA